MHPRLLEPLLLRLERCKPLHTLSIINSSDAERSLVEELLELWVPFPTVQLSLNTD
jgi:hypothetical protein